MKAANVWITAWVSAGVLASCWAVSCNSGLPRPGGLDEPIRVQNAQFRAGDMPGLPPLTDEQVDGGIAAEGPHVTDVQTLDQVIWNGEAGKSLSGHASVDALTVGMRFADLGTGYWMFPVDGADPQSGGELTWSATVDIGQGLPAGYHELRVAAFDAQGRAGTEKTLKLCVAGVVHSDLSACSPKSKPPQAVLSLTWDSPADLDLRLITPTGKVVQWETPSTAEATDGGVPAPALGDPSTGVLSGDAVHGCVGGQREEDVVWKGAPARGTYLVYADLYDACGQAAVHFTVTLYLAQAQDDGTFRLTEALKKTGEVTADLASGGSAPGLYVTDITFN